MPGRHEDPVWRCFDKMKAASGKDYDVGKCKGCGESVSGIFLHRGILSPCVFLGSGGPQKLRPHANECEKLQELKL